MGNPRPCECEHPKSEHSGSLGGDWCRRCWDTLARAAGDGSTPCESYRKRLRTEPLRAKRQWAPSDGRIEIHVHVPGPVTELTKDRLIQMLSEMRGEALR